VCYFSLVSSMQCACAIFHVWLDRLYKIFSTLSHKGHDFRKKKILLNIKCVFGFNTQLLSVTYFILRRNERAIIKTVYWSSHKISVILVRCSENLFFSDRLLKNTQISIFMKISPMRAVSFHAHRRTDGQT